MSITEVINNPQYYVDYIDTNYTILSTVSAKRLAAYRDLQGTAQNFYISTACNLNLEAVTNVTIFSSNQGLVTLQSSNASNYLSFYNSNNTSAVISTASNQKLAIKSADSNLTLNISGMTLTNDTVQQIFTTTATKGFKLTAKSVQCCNMFASDTVFGRELVMYNRYTSRSNVGDVAEVGYGFRLNSNLELEIVKYGSVVQAGGQQRKVAKKVAAYGMRAFTNASTTDSNLGTYNPYAALSNLI